MTRSRLILLGLVFLTASLVAQQRFTPPSAASLPTNCNIGDLATKTTDPAGLYVCTATDTWTIVGGGAGVPDGWTWDTDALTSEVIAPVTQPTFAEVLAEHPEITPTWAALSDLSYSSDCIVLVNGGGKAFIAEYFSGDLTGASEPNWASAPNAGDTVSDGDVTWVATAKTWATALATTPTTWTANHDYSPDVSSPVLIWPTTPNGHLYLAYPVPLTSDSSEPDFGTDFGLYTQDNDGYWMDAGTAATTTRSITSDVITARTTLTAETAFVLSAATFTNVTGLTPNTLANEIFSDETGIASSLGVTDNGTTAFAWEWAVAFAPTGNRTASSSVGYQFDLLFQTDHTYPGLPADIATFLKATGGTFSQGLANVYLGTSLTNSAGTFYRPFYIQSPNLLGTTSFTEEQAIWVGDLATSKVTNIYYEWFDSQGVRRVREDPTFNSVGQAIEALYNPQFTKYTAGAVNFERIILGQWNSNVAEIGTEKGGTGTLRNLRLIGEGLEFGAALVDPASSGTRFLCINTAGVVTSSASACSGT